MEQYKQGKKKMGDEIQGIGFGGNEVLVLEPVVDGNIHS
jgi:hypothetical protein